MRHVSAGQGDGRPGICEDGRGLLRTAGGG